MRKFVTKYLVFLLVSVFLAGCNATRFLQENETLLSGVKVESTDKHVKASDYRPYVRQEPNSRWFNLLRVPLGLYCISGNDSTKRVNKFFRRIGQAPVVYDHSLTNYTTNALHSALQSKGYYHAEVKADTITKKRRTKVVYTLNPGRRYNVDIIHYESDSKEMYEILQQLSDRTLLKKGMPLDESILSSERERIIDVLRNRGYYNVNNEYISFRADTIAGITGVELTMLMARPTKMDSAKAYGVYKVRDVMLTENAQEEHSDTSSYKGLLFISQKRPKLFRRVYEGHVAVKPGNIVSERAMQRTYGNLNNLPIVNYSTLRYHEVPGDSALLDCNIDVVLKKKHAISAELEGTNTAGDFGAALSLTYTNRNIFRGAELFSLKARGAYEAITGLDGYQNSNYIEYNIEGSLRFPSFKLPFIPSERKSGYKASSEFSLLYNTQDRPEFHRRVLTGTWGYRWSKISNSRLTHHFDLLSLNYIFMPWISDTFREEYLDGDDPHYSILRYSYEDLFIMKMGYGFVYNSLRNQRSNGLFQTNGYQIRFNAEMAGNLLYGLSHLFHAKRNTDGQYTLFDIAYSQYVKFDFDYAKSVVINDRNSVAFHAAFGIAIPYGNSTIVPYEKRYFSGGANSVRGWSVRELGPGSYEGKDGKIDFINQTGNLKLDLSIEYRTHLFWKFDGAVFIDAGNIWNLRNYPDQPGGQFRFDKFYKQIAVAYGLGIRLNFDYFIIRFDGGMKAINPARSSMKGHYPLINPKFSRDFAFHFAVGLPF